MERRSFLIGTGMFALSQALAACGNQGQNALKIQLLKGSIPIQLIEEFPKLTDPAISLDIQVVEQLQEAFANLERLSLATGKPVDNFWAWLPGQSQTPTPPDLISLGDGWFQSAIAQKLIKPLPIKDLPSWQRLSRRWQGFVQRDAQGNPEENGQIWGAPYRWGTTMIVYRRDKFRELGWIPQDWGDLWRQELRGKISLLDQPREVIGLTLKKLGHSYNTQDLSKIPTLKSELQSLNQQAKFYSSDRYLQPLILEDTWAAVGWSTDILPLVKRNPQLGAIIPASGTALWADLWVEPQGRDLSEGAKSWIDFCWKPATANKLSLLSNATSPIVTTMKPEELLPDLLKNPLIMPSSAVIDRSEFLDPLPPEVLAQYTALWQEMRQRV
jgi:putative spermidine/putrescine transport system substrate-binding protein